VHTLTFPILLLFGAALFANMFLLAVGTIWVVHKPPAAKSIGPVGDGFLAVNPDAFPNDFAADVPGPVARFMAISQVPVSGDALKAKATVAAWKQKPSYAVIPMQDRMINPDLERFMTKRAQSQVIELPGSHTIFLSHAPEVAALVEKAATEAK
jgi:pimeloyl-ACP methyl ester carboxylesterase